MTRSLFHEFRPTIFFLGKFIGIYLVANVVYGLFVTHYRPEPDPVTRWVSYQSGNVLTACGWPIEVYDHHKKPTTSLLYNNRPALSIYEGCNGINTAIIFIAFLIAFGPINRKLLWFIPLGLLIIHIANLLRITLLFLITQFRPDYMYFVHKYVFTAVLYMVIFALWVWWVKKFGLRKSE